jgi:hypothetical protein
MQVKDGQVGHLNALMSDRGGDEALKAKGWEMSCVGVSKSNPNEVMGCVVWDTSDRYYANAESPEQNALYEELRALLASEPEWFDCDVLSEERA